MGPISQGSLRLIGRKQKTEADMAMSFSKLGETKVTVPLILLVFLFYIGWEAKDFTIEGLDEFFISEAEGGEMTEQIEGLNKTLTKYIEKSEIREINREIRETNEQVTETQLWIAANGGNTIATARLGELVERRNTLTDTKACLLNDNIDDKEICYVE